MNPSSIHVWLRAESDSEDVRTPLTPEGAGSLKEAGFRVTVEESPRRIFSDENYASVGAELAAAGDWKRAPADAYILGLSHPQPETEPLTQRHILPSRRFDRAVARAALLKRFKGGTGLLLDLDGMLGPQGDRLVSFDRWSGYCGSGLGLIVWAHRHLFQDAQDFPPFHRFQGTEQFISHVNLRYTKAIQAISQKPKVVIAGSDSVIGKGAAEFLRKLDLTPTLWDRAKLRADGPWPDLLGFDVLINAQTTTPPHPPLLTSELLKAQSGRLRTIVDLRGEPGASGHPLPIYDRTGSFQMPFMNLRARPLLDVVAVPDACRALPREASEEFSRKLTPLLKEIGGNAPAWKKVEAVFREIMRRL